MRVTSIELTNWLAHRHLTLNLSPMAILAGPNGAGKSSVADAIAFVLEGRLRRVQSKGDRKHLVTAGTAKGNVRMAFGDALLERDIASGKLTKSTAIPAPDGAAYDALPACLIAPFFAQMDAAGRRSMLQAVLQAEPSLARLLPELKARGISEPVLGQLGKAMHGDVTGWQDMAKTRATEGRGVWKSLTNETYGSVKADSWKAAEVEAPSQETLDEAVRVVAAAQETARRADQTQGAAIEYAKARRQRAEDLTRRRSEAEAFAKVEADWPQINAAERDARAAWERASEDLAANRIAAQPVMDCPHCGCGVTPDGKGGLLQASDTIQRPDQAIIDSQEAHVAEKLKELNAATKARQDAEKAIVQSHAAKARVAELEAAIAAADKAAPPINDDAEAASQRAWDTVEAANVKLRDLQRQRDDAASAAATTEKAATYHQRIAEWTRVAELISLDGIPAELLDKAMDPLRTLLRDLAQGSHWREVAIGADMAITADGRPYELLSESEQWRADATIAIALAMLSQMRLVVLDRFDVLDVPSRKPAMSWLYQLVKSNRLDQCLLIGTTKEKPQAPRDVSVFWLGGEPSQQQAA